MELDIDKESDSIVRMQDPLLEIVVPEGEPTMFSAVRFGDMEMINRQLHLGFDLNLKTQDDAYKVKSLTMSHRISSTHYAVLHLAALHSTTKVIEKLLESGADIDILDMQQRTPLHFAVVANRIPVVKLLIAKGANIDVQSSSGRTPLLEAVINGSFEVAVILIQSGAQLDLVDTKGTSVLHHLCFSRDPNLHIIEMVLQHKGNPNITNLKGGTPLMFASTLKKHFSVKLIKLLLEYGADINQTDNHGRAAIHFVVELKTTFNFTDNILLFLIKNGASVDIIDKNGLTLLDMAMKNSSLPTIKCLLLMDCPRNTFHILNNPQMVYVCDMVPEFKDWLNKELFNPRPLMRLCRGKIRSCLSPDNLTKVDKLDIPRQLQNFLLGYDIVPENLK